MRYEAVIENKKNHLQKGLKIWYGAVIILHF